MKKGINKIKRNSADSNITISYEELFAMSRDNISDCGWPDYLLIPKGTPEGLGAVLFVMISDGLEDVVTDCSFCHILDSVFVQKFEYLFLSDLFHSLGGLHGDGLSL